MKNTKSNKAMIDTNEASCLERDLLPVPQDCTFVVSIAIDSNTSLVQLGDQLQLLREFGLI